MWKLYVKIYKLQYEILMMVEDMKWFRKLVFEKEKIEKNLKHLKI